MSEILSYGGGLQTVAICILIAKGQMPKPDAVIVADTGREMPSTWNYAEQYTRPLLKEIGLDLHIAGHHLATVDLYAHNGDVLLPAYTSTGRLRTFCSSEWKGFVVQRYATQILKLPHPIWHWIGFSLDEQHRMKARDKRRFPLIELSLTRADCERIVEQHGWPLPSKSRCWMCPHQSNREWREVRDHYPEQWAEAIRIDTDIRKADDREDLYLHQSRVPLAEADLDKPEKREPTRQCGLGYCFI